MVLQAVRPAGSTGVVPGDLVVMHRLFVYWIAESFPESFGMWQAIATRALLSIPVRIVQVSSRSRQANRPGLAIVQIHWVSNRSNRYGR